MGNTGSSSGRPHNDDTVDYGYLAPQGVYTGAKDWNHTIVTQLIIDRKLAPFYRPLEEYSEDWDDEQILAARRDPPDSDAGRTDSAPRADSRDNARPASLTKRPNNLKEPSRIPEAALYRGAVECPICFLVGLSHACSLWSLTLLEFSTTLRILIAPVAVIKPSARSVLYRSRESNLPPPTLFPSPHRALIVSKTTLVSYILRRYGVLASAVKERSVHFVPWRRVVYAISHKMDDDSHPFLRHFHRG